MSTHCLFRYPIYITYLDDVGYCLTKVIFGKYLGISKYLPELLPSQVGPVCFSFYKGSPVFIKSGLNSIEKKLGLGNVNEY